MENKKKEPRHYKTLTFTNRLQIEAWLRVKTPIKDIARYLGVHISTVYRELQRGQYEHLNSDYTTEWRYSPDIAEQHKQDNLRAKGADLKIGKDHALAAHIEKKIREDKYSPEAVLGEIKAKGLKFETSISRTTLYRYIDDGLFLTITNENLPIKRNKGRYKKVQPAPARAPRGESIEKRPDEIGERVTFGNWEMDCVEGKKGTKATLLVLTERFSRWEIIRKIKEKTMESVVSVLNQLEKEWGERFNKVFQTITVDNGCEFSDCAGMERSVDGGKRTKVYYCHPYSSWERGSNENQNKMIRRHYPKGMSFEHIGESDVQRVQDWLNNYPRAMFDYMTAADIFAACLNSAA